VRDTKFNSGGGGGRAKFTAIKDPWQCQFVLLVKVVWREGKTFGSEEGRDKRWSKERVEQGSTEFITSSSDIEPWESSVWRN
jgi:hypothetical protein